VKPRMGMSYSVAIGLGCVVGAAACSGGAAFRGNGVVTDHGRVAFPRYEIAMRPQISLARTQTYTFEFSGMPRDRMDFGFRPTSKVTERDVRSQSVVLRSALRQADTGKVIGGCAIGTKTDEITVGGNRNTGEVLHVWSPSCVGVRLDPSKTYSLTVAVEVPPGSEHQEFEVEAIFRGGGIELP